MRTACMTKTQMIKAKTKQKDEYLYFVFKIKSWASDDPTHKFEQAALNVRDRKGFTDGRVKNSELKCQ